MPRSAALEVGRERQLFVDDAILDSTRGLRQRLHTLKKRPENPVLSSSRPWEIQRVNMHGTVLRDPETGELRMWYYASAASPDEKRYRSVVAYATSLDGIHWEKPDLRLYDYHGQTANNICRRPHFDATGDPWYVDAICVLYDPDDPDPLRRYKMGTTQKKTGDEFNTETPYPSGVYFAFSPDGLRWREDPTPHFTMLQGFSDTLGVMADPRHKRYVAHVKIGVPDYRAFERYNWLAGTGYLGLRKGEWVPFKGKRRRGVTVSEDFLHWSDPEFILEIPPDEPEADQVYDTSIFPYESLYLGLADVYHPNDTGTIDSRLIWSPDGVDWRWAFDRTPILPVGRDLCDWDCGGHCTSNNPPIRMGDELWFYYGASCWRHPGGKIKRFRPPRGGSSVGVATLRVDGFVSLDAGARRGRAVTAPLRPTHDALCVNADASAGELRAQILRRGQPLPGFDFKSCEPLRWDATRHVLRFFGGVLPTGRPVRVEFALRNASLYSFWTEPTPPTPE